MSKIKNCLKCIFQSSPDMIKNVIDFVINSIPNNVRFGNAYIEFKKELEAECDYTREKIELLQFEKLQKLLIHAYETTDFYKELFNDNMFNPYHMKSVKDIEKIPIIGKIDMQKNIKRMKSKVFKENEFIPITTGGTSGNQMKFYAQNSFTFSREKAITNYYFQTGGCKNDVDKKVIIRNIFFPGEILWKYNYRDRSLYIDTFNLTDDNCRRIIKKLNRLVV